MKPITKASLRANACRVLKSVEQMIRDVRWWNNHRTDEPPLDCEGELQLAQLIRQNIAAIDADDMHEAARLSKAMKEKAEQTLREGFAPMEENP